MKLHCLSSIQVWLRTAALAANLVATTRIAPADEPDYGGELPRIPAVEPHEALASFRLSSDHFEIEQVAAEPLVASPVAIDFDADGRIFVAEMRDYSEQDKEHLGRVRLLEDTDHDGRFDKATIFADGLSWPTAVACANGGVFVGAAPHIYFLKDDDGDGRADTKQIVLTGFKRDNVQGLLNSFHWGIDNRLHGATSTAGGDVHRPDDANPKPLSLRGRDFSIDTRTLEIRAESGGGQHGMSFDDWGRKFVSSNSDHIQLIVAEDRYLARNLFLSAPPPRVSIAADGPQAEVFRESPVEPWRILRTRLRVSGLATGPIEGGGRAAGYFTGATGVTIYRGDAWPAEYHGNAFIGDVGSNIVHRKTLEPDGVLLVASRAEARREFLASRDTWFRPAQFANGPDGNLYVIDVYREVIEHPASLPPPIKRHLDLTSGRDRGRIYRIKPKEFKQRPPVRLSGAAAPALVALLEHTNGWHRQTAARLLYERNDKSAIPLLMELAAKSKSPLGRMHALRALDGLRGLNIQIILGALADDHPSVRRHAVELTEWLPESADVTASLLKMAADENLLVRYQLSFMLGELKTSERTSALAAIARRDAAHPWMRVALQSSLAEGAVDVLADLLADVSFRRTEHGSEFLQALARQIGAQNREGDIERVDAALRALARATSDGQVVRSIAVALVQALAKGSGRGAARQEMLLKHRAIAEAAGQAISQALATAVDAKRGIAERQQAIEALTLAPFTETSDAFAILLAVDQPNEIQWAAVAKLAGLRDPQAAELLLDRWSGFTPRLRAAAIEGLFADRASLDRLLTAIERGGISPGEIDSTRVQQLVRHNDRGLRERAKRLWAATPKRDREEIVRQYQQALNMKGSPDKGRAVFRTTCAGCHRAEGEGHELAPNLVTVQNRGPDAILLNVLDPNREVNPQFVNYLVVTKDGRTASGMIAGESATNVTLKRGEGQSETILRGEIEELTSTGMSLMPEGLEKQIDVAAMADLIAYLTTLK
ncbi:MAG: PVC-type heme-binding CxxCH protein [Pirellulales bacterium]